MPIAVRGLFAMALPTSSPSSTAMHPSTTSAGPKDSTSTEPSTARSATAMLPSSTTRKLPSLMMASASLPMVLSRKITPPRTT